MAPRAPRISAAQVQSAREVDTGPFWWGVSTSSFQNEDRGVPPGSPEYFETDWDVYIKKGIVPERGNATWSWTNFDKDLQLLKELGVTHYRFSIEWARVEPKPGQFNEKAIRHYAEMARKLRAAGIEPVVTLWHFTIPDWLTDADHPRRSHFLHPLYAEHWRRYVEKMADALAPHVRIYVPQNEPNGMLALGYLAGHWPPRLLLAPFSYKKALAECARQFREAAEIIRSRRNDALIVCIQALPYWRKSLLGDPTRAVYNTMLRVNYDHLDQIHDVCDLIGFNYYYSQTATLADFFYRGRGEKSRNYTQMGWVIDPEGFYNVIQQVYRRYKKPIVITENGIGTLNEQKKVKYLRDHINQMRFAMAEGADVRGYFVWTLLDNFEWAEGYAANFGLAIRNPKTGKWQLEPSGLYYKEIIKRNRNLRGNLNKSNYILRIISEN